MPSFSIIYTNKNYAVLIKRSHSNINYAENGNLTTLFQF